MKIFKNLKEKSFGIFFVNRILKRESGLKNSHMLTKAFKITFDLYFFPTEFNQSIKKNTLGFQVQQNSFILVFMLI